jgi:hypothetical protein
MKANIINRQLLIFVFYQLIIFGGRYFFGSKQILNLEIPALVIHWIFLFSMSCYWWVKKQNAKATEYILAFLVVFAIGFGSCAFLVMDNLHG